MADPVFTPEHIAPFADEVRNAVKDADPLRKDTIIFKAIAKSVHSTEVKPEDMLALLPLDLRMRIADAAKRKTSSVERVPIETDGYTCKTRTTGTYNDRDYEYDPEVGWKNSLTKEQQCTKFKKWVTVYKAGTPVLAVNADAFFTDDVQDESTISFPLQDLVITVMWIEHPVNHEPVARDFLAILRKAGMPEEVMEFFEDFDYVVEQNISVSANARIEIQVPAFHGRKRSATQSTEPNKRKK